LLVAAEVPFHDGCPVVGTFRQVDGEVQMQVFTRTKPVPVSEGRVLEKDIRLTMIEIALQKSRKNIPTPVELAYGA
jgi:hypothetical protein